jgi:competence protein ComEC
LAGLRHYVCFRLWKQCFELELGNYFLFIPIFIALGIAISLSGNISGLYVGAVMLMLMGCYYYRPHPLLVLLGFLCTGYFATEVRVWRVTAPVIGHNLEDVWLEGDIVQIMDGDNNHKLLLDNLAIEMTAVAPLPRSVRISTKGDVSHLDVGTRIRVWVTLMPPPGPVVPGGFSFKRYAYFKQIGAIGYAKSRIQIVMHEPNLNTFIKFINNVRQNIKSKIYKCLHKDAASIITALLIGDSSGISKENFAAIRQSGIAHIIAISGMHIMIVVGCLFYIIRWSILRIFPNFASYYDSKKIAAVISIAGSLIYLMLAGHPISAQRAFIMAVVVLMAMILDRDHDPLRAIASAAIIVLLLFPESLLSASFQMSFAAALGLISAFSLMRKHWPSLPTSRWLPKIGLYVMTTTFSSVIAGLATTPFVIYHFNQFSAYSLLTNLFAIPLTNFIIMPLGIITMVLIPLSLEGITLPLMGMATKWMLYLAHGISEIDGAWIYVPSFSAVSIAFLALGGVLLCIMQTKLRLTGLLFLSWGLVLYQPSVPDIMIEQKGELIALKHQKQYYFSTLAKARFVRTSWQQYYGIDSNCKLNSLPQCRDGVCDFGNLIIVLKSASTAPVLRSGCLIIDLREKREKLDNLANQHIIDLNTLQKNGHLFIWLKENSAVVKNISDELV